MINTDVLKDLDNKDVGFYISKIEKNDHTLLENIVEKHLQNLFEIDYINNSKINFSNYLDKVNQKDHQKICHFHILMLEPCIKINGFGIWELEK